MKLLKNISTKVGVASLAASAWVSTTLAFDAGQVSALEPSSSESIKDAVTGLVNVILAIVGILAVVYLIYGGILYITAGGDAEKAGKGRVAITNAIIGIIIIIASAIIYNGVRGSFTGNSTDVLK